MRSLLQAAPNLGLVLTQEILDELLARIVGNAFGRVHQAQRRGRDHGLLHRHVRVAHRHLEVRIRVAPVREWSAREPWHAPGVAVGEGNPETVGGRIGLPVDRVGRKVMVLALLAVADHRRAAGFEALEGVANRCFVQRSERRILAIGPGERGDKFRWPRDAANGLGGEGPAHARPVGVSCGLVCAASVSLSRCNGLPNRAAAAIASGSGGYDFGLDRDLQLHR